MASKKSTKGKRYTDEEKQVIIDFVNEYNAANGRGGAANASKKFGVSQLTVGAWLKGKGGAKKGRKAAKKVSKKAVKGARRGRPPGRKETVATAGAGDRSDVLAALSKADKEISAKRKELAALEAKFEKLKGSL